MRVSFSLPEINDSILLMRCVCLTEKLSHAVRKSQTHPRLLDKTQGVARVGCSDLLGRRVSSQPLLQICYLSCDHLVGLHKLID